MSRLQTNSRIVSGRSLIIIMAAFSHHLARYGPEDPASTHKDLRTLEFDLYFLIVHALDLPKVQACNAGVMRVSLRWLEPL